jgi:beta-lactam-binding protein with PASTA domain
MTQAEAAELLFEEGLGLDVESRRFSDSVLEGQILDQNPAPGVSVKSARSVGVLLSLGERQFPVPDVEGSSLRSAQMLLGQRGLRLGNTLYAHTDLGEASTVLYQFPLAGDMGGADPVVNVLVSMGPIEDYYIMPDVTGQRADQVTPRMRSEGFRLVEIAYTRQAGVTRGRILGQTPRAGYKVSKTDIIRLEVSE